MSAAVSIDWLEQQARWSLETRLCDAMGFGLTTASPLQRALCRIADGRGLGDLQYDSVVSRALGGSHPPQAKPREIAILSGIRVGKSLLAACLAVHWTQTCDVTRLGPGEIPRVSIVSLTKDLADVVFAHVVGRLQQSMLLSHLIVGEPSHDTVHLRHPTGRVVQIKVVAGSRAGASLVARWSAGCIFDEFPRMVGGADGVINWDDSRDAVLLRLLPGCQLVHIGSPWAPDGPAYELVSDLWGKPSKQMVVVKAPAFDMNPHYWTPELVEKTRLECESNVQRKVVKSFRTDVLAEFATPDEALFSSDLVQASIRPESPYEEGCTYVAAMDPATRGNGWTFGIFTRQGKRKRMVLAREWRGTPSAPLSPRTVLADIATICREFKVWTVSTDQYYVDALQDIAREQGLSLIQEKVTEADKTARYIGIRTKLAEGEIELVPDVRTDMMRLRKRITQNGVAIILPLSSDGRHCDFAPTVMLGLGRWLKDEEPVAKVKAEDIEMKQMLESTMRRYSRPREDLWDD